MLDELMESGKEPVALRRFRTFCRDPWLIDWIDHLSENQAISFCLGLGEFAEYWYNKGYEFSESYDEEE